jgi:hypothetical protein
MRRKFDPCGARKHAHPALRQAVGDVAGHWPILVHRSDVYDAAAVALLDHLPGGELRAEKGALEVNGEYLLVLFFRRIEHGSACLDASVIDHDVEAAKILDRGVDQALTIDRPIPLFPPVTMAILPFRFTNHLLLYVLIVGGHL